MIALYFFADWGKKFAKKLRAEIQADLDKAFGMGGGQNSQRGDVHIGR